MNLPKSFNYSLIDKNKYRVDIKNEKDIYKWLNEYKGIYFSSWRATNTKKNTPHYLCSITYVCHHSGYQRVPSNTNKKGKSKNSNCMAKIKISIKHTTKDTIKKDKFVKDGLPGIINIIGDHNHNLESGESLSYLRPSAETRAKYFSYFDNGMGIKESLVYHESKLEFEFGFDSKLLANAEINPKYRTVQHWHDIWRTENLGPRDGIGVLEKIKQKVNVYEAEGILVKYNENPFAIIVVTPIMQRAHNLPFAKDVVFTDSTASCDALSHSVSFMLTPCGIGAVPLAVIITKGQTIEDYTAAYQLLKGSIPNAFGGMGYPKIFITDDSDAERKALKNVWPASKTHLCRFHICQSIWRWLCEKKNGIPQDERQFLFKTFQTILLASTIEKATESFKITLEDQRFPQWKKYITEYWKRKEDWCLAYRDASTHGHQTNNFSEITVRLFKDIVLHRNKAYNAIALIYFSCTALEEYYRRRLRNFVNNRDAAPRLLFKRQLEKIKYLKKEDIIKLSENLYKVPSEQNCDVLYEVDIATGFCSCEIGRLGAFCKHQAAIAHIFNISFCNVPATNPEDRYEIAKLAFGEKVQPFSFYSGLVGSSVCITEKYTNNNFNNMDENNVREDISINNNETAKQQEISFADFINTLQDKDVTFGTDSSTLKLLNERLSHIKTKTAWESFLNTAGSSSARRFGHKASIRVQPTSISRRKLGVTRGSKRLPFGRPPKDEPSKKRLKRRHNLSANIAENQRNATKHGEGH